MAFAPDHAYDLIARAHAQDRLAHAFLISGSSNDDLRTLFELTKLDTLFQISENRDEALKSL